MATTQQTTEELAYLLYRQLRIGIWASVQDIRETRPDLPESVIEGVQMWVDADAISQM